ncbi:MAG: universal stress protein [Saprospiraceae bacterium]|nr:universal stress protein [Saprospiraceae bacterium]
MKRILVPTDFSENANNAFFYALGVAYETGATITLLHVVELEMEVLDIPMPSGSAYQARKDAAELAMDAQVELAQGIDGDWEDVIAAVNKKVVVGNPTGHIKSVAEDIDADVIIMGARGRHKNTFAKMLGTRSSDIAQEAPVPVLIVPEGAIFKSFVQIAYASELLTTDPYHLWRALELIKPFSPVVRYLHVSQFADDEELEKEQKIRKYIESQNAALQLIFYHVIGQNIDKELEKYSRTFEVDLIVIYHEQKNIFQRMFTHSHTKHLLSMSDIPVLVLKED